VALLGANGSGKSTLLRAVLGLARPVSGEVRVFGRNPATAFDELRPQVGAVLQDVEAQLLAPTVREDLAYGLQGSGLSKEEIGARVRRVAAAFRLEDVLDRVPHYLSGGERRKVALAGALVTEPRLLVLDEPFGGLDPRSREELVELIGRAHGDRELTLLLATHEVDQLPRLVDTVCVLRQDGEVRAYGQVREVLAMEEVLRECNVEPPVLGRLRLALERRGMTVPVEAADDVEALANVLARP
jgi:cobalt/nickel transport system ATP-binding protein